MTVVPGAGTAVMSVASGCMSARQATRQATRIKNGADCATQHNTLTTQVHGQHGGAHHAMLSCCSTHGRPHTSTPGNAGVAQKRRRLHHVIRTYTGTAAPDGGTAGGSCCSRISTAPHS